MQPAALSAPGVLLSSFTFLLLLGDPEVFPGQMTYMIDPKLSFQCQETFECGVWIRCPTEVPGRIQLQRSVRISNQSQLQAGWLSDGTAAASK